MNVIRVLKNEYRDSLYLLKLSSEISRWEGVKQAVIVSGTDNNKRILDQVNLLQDEAISAKPDDIIIAIEIEEGQKERSQEIMSRLVSHLNKPVVPEGGYKYYPRLEDALSKETNSRLVVISTPGEYATQLAQIALERGNHVFCFSHHVSISDELFLKDFAVSRGLLMMGPDCGTAIIDGYGFGFANVIRPGRIGLVSASGSGLQEVTSLIHRAGGGISHAIGVGGRDLLSPINGLMAQYAVRLLGRDPSTSVIVVLAKASDIDAQRVVIEELKATGKSFVVDFSSPTDQAEIIDSQHEADTFEDCAIKSLLLAGYKLNTDLALESEDFQYSNYLNSLEKGRTLLWGLYSGGSLAGEARRVLSRMEIKALNKFSLTSDHQPDGHLIVDLGDEEYTEGRAHPFIDPRLRNLIIEKAFADRRVGVLLLDVVLGWGSHKDPAGEITSTIIKCSRIFDNGPIVIAYVCGTSEDPQGYDDQKRKLQDLGVIVPETNSQAAKIAGKIVALIGQATHD